MEYKKEVKIIALVDTYKDEDYNDYKIKNGQ